MHSDRGHPIHDRAAEEAVIGAVLLSPTDFHRVPLEPEHFFYPEHRLAWEAMQDLAQENTPIDPVLVDAKTKGAVDALKLAELADRVPTSANLMHYADRVRAVAITRAVEEGCGRVVAAAEEGSDLLRVMHEELAAIESGTMTGTVDSVSGMDEFLRDAERDTTDGSDRDIVTTGIEEWDRFFWAEPGDIITIAGRPGMGKTAAMIWSAWQYVSNGHPWLVCLAEGTRRKFYRRLISMLTGINTKAIRERRLSMTDTLDIRDAADRIRSVPLYVNDSCRYLPNMLRAIRGGKHEHGIKGVSVDYLQRVTVPGSLREYDRINMVCDSLSNIADESPRVVMMQLSQLSREVEKEEDKRASLRHLRGSGEIEQGSDIVAFPWRGWYYDRKKHDARRMEVDVAKARDGETGTLVMEWENAHGFIVGPDSHIATRQSEQQSLD